MMKNSAKSTVNNLPFHPNEMDLNELQSSIEIINNSLEEHRVAIIRSTFSKISSRIAIKKALNVENCLPVEIVKIVNECAKQNNIKLKRNTKSALKKYTRLGLNEDSAELKKLLTNIEEYIITYGYLDFNKKSKHK